VPPYHIEHNVQIGAGCTIGPNVYIEHGCIIGDGAALRDAVVLRGRVVPAAAQFEGQVVS
jgi:acetyltransferase-like isoleucine patch superfamily enzyme